MKIKKEELEEVKEKTELPEIKIQNAIHNYDEGPMVGLILSLNNIQQSAQRAISCMEQLGVKTAKIKEGE